MNKGTDRLGNGPYKSCRACSPNRPDGSFPERTDACKEKDMRRIAGILAVSLIILFVSGVYAQEEQKETYIREYRIGPWDVLEVSVYGEEDYTGVRIQVTEYGRIKLPLLDEVEVLGLTQGELEEKLKQLFMEGAIFQNPSVTVLVAERQSQRVSLLGAVANPGRYELLGRQELLHIIAEAGGFTTYGGEVTVIRGQFDPLKVPIKELISGDDKFNIPLQPNDIIIVSPEETVFIYVTGAVGSPGALQVPKSNIPTLYRAIVQAGGFTERASKGNVKIKRMDESGKEIIIDVNAKDIEKGKKKDIPLQAGDVVIVGEKIF